MLWSETHWPDVILRSELTFAPNGVAVVRHQLSNVGSDIQHWDIDMTGALRDTTRRFQRDAGGVYCTFRDAELKIKAAHDKYYFKNSTLQGSSFVHDIDDVALAPGQTWNKLMTLDLRFFTGGFDRINYRDLDFVFDENQTRWQKMLAPYATKFAEHEELYKLSAKCLTTLMANWKRPAGQLKHDGLFPSNHEEWFHGIWAWDSWKHAAALAQIDPHLAKEQVRAMFVFQNEAGMVADCAFRDPDIEETNWENTKPPLATWAVKMIHDATGDDDFVVEMMPQLIAYHQWWERRRNHDPNQMFAYGSENSSKKTALWESGMDNAVRFDYAGYFVFPPNYYGALDFKNVDLNCYLYQEQLLIEELLEKTSSTEEFPFERLFSENPVDYFWSKNDKFFFEVRQNEKIAPSFVKIKGPESLAPLFTQTCSQSQAKDVVDVMMTDSIFNTYVPFPTVDATHDKFDPQEGYWRGPVWIDQAYFGVKGMRNYGFEKEANAQTLKLIHNAEGILGNAPLRENYNPLTGEGLNAKHFSWTAACLLLMLDDLTLDAEQ
ncbi:MAG: hypothetical protein HKN32_01350 [Flavobacteriales bacterium]|nr:hypothetical protein [Flavobacteriales bacterium]